MNNPNLLISIENKTRPSKVMGRLCVFKYLPALFFIIFMLLGQPARACFSAGGFANICSEEAIEDIVEAALEEAVETRVEEPIEETVVENIEESLEEDIEQSIEGEIEDIVQESVAQTVEDSVQENVAQSIEESVQENVAESVEESVQESVAQSVEESVQDSVAQTVEESVQDNVAESVEESVQESVAESVEESVQENVAQSVEESVQENVAQSVEESVQDNVAQSVEESVQENVAQSVEESVQENVAQSVEESVQENVAQSVEESVQENVAQSVEESVQDNVAQSVEESVQENVAQSVEESVQENVAQSVEESVQDNVAQSVEESVQENVAQSVEESVQENVAQSVEESVQENVAQSVEESVQENVAQSVEESVQENVAQSVEESVQENVAQSVQESVAASVEEEVSQTIEESVAQSLEQGVEGDFERGIENEVADAIEDRLESTIDLILEGVESEFEVDESRIRKDQWLVMAEPEVFEKLASEGYLFDKVTELPGIGMRLAEVAAPSSFDITEMRQGVMDVLGSDRAEVDLNHIYTAGSPVSPSQEDGVFPRAAIAFPADTKDLALRIGMIDSLVDTSHPALSRSNIHSRSFTPEGAPLPDFHGTAIASIIAGNTAEYQGLAPNSEVFAAAVFQKDSERGEIASTVSLVMALDWLISSDVGVINISLAGPPNRLLQAALERAAEKDVMILAAAGNGGPIAKPMYPAAYESVVAVTAVDKRGQVFRLANRGEYLDLAAPGVSMLHAKAGGGYATSSGTSFAVPFAATAAARLRQLMPGRNVLELLHNSAEDLGSPGWDEVYGHGLLRPDVAPTIGVQTASR